MVELQPNRGANVGAECDPRRLEYGVHLNSGNYSFVDGHAQTNKFRPLEDWWFATGGGLADADCRLQTRGEYAYTYPPGLNTERDVASAEWWPIPWYPLGPIFDRSSIPTQP